MRPRETNNTTNHFELNGKNMSDFLFQRRDIFFNLKENIKRFKIYFQKLLEHSIWNMDCVIFL